MRAMAVIVGCTILGCVPEPDGVWLLTLTLDEESTECTETLTENFTYGYEPTSGGSAEWTVEESQSSTQELAFVEIIPTTDQQAVLIWGEEAWPGVWNTSYWQFSWEESTSYSTNNTHIAGYSNSESNVDEVQDVIDFTIDGDTATGTMTSTSTSQQIWEESDIWNDVLAKEIGQTGVIPSSSYLVELIPGATGETPVSNQYSSPDCDSDPCQIKVETTCSQIWTFEGVRTQSDTKNQDYNVYDHLGGVGQ